jgi:hypothetical protein
MIMRVWLRIMARSSLAGASSQRRWESVNSSRRGMAVPVEVQSYREISHRLGLSNNTVLDIVKRDRAA